MEKRNRAFVHRISKYANLKNWKDFLNITEIEDEAYGKKGLESVKIFVWQGIQGVEDEMCGKKDWKESRFSYTGG